MHSIHETHVSIRVAGFAGAMLDTPWFVSEQIPQAEPFDVHETSIVLAWQLGNLYLLMAFMGVAILYGTSELKVVRNYLFVLWLGDIGHVGFSCYAMGMERLMRPREWNAIASGNITFTVGVGALLAVASVRLLT